MREWQFTVNWEHDGCIVDEQVQASIALLQEVSQLSNGLLVANVKLVKLDLNSILKRSRNLLADGDKGLLPK